jgi:C-8 sterol isomerase
MPFKSSGNKMSVSGCGGRYFSLWNLSLLAVFLAVSSALYSFLDARLDQFYIFDPEHLHDLSQHAIMTYGEDTRSIVSFIVAELQEKVGEKYLNTIEEWVFNNAGGAMGAMYIIHASKRQSIL